MIVFQRGSITGEIEASYSGATGERVDLRLWIVETGPRGGRHTIWSGSARDARRMRDDLTAMLAGIATIPERLSDEAMSRSSEGS